MPQLRPFSFFIGVEVFQLDPSVPAPDFPGEPCWFTFDNRRLYCLQAIADFSSNSSELRKRVRDN